MHRNHTVYAYSVRINASGEPVGPSFLCYEKVKNYFSTPFREFKAKKRSVRVCVRACVWGECMRGIRVSKIS